MDEGMSPAQAVDAIAKKTLEQAVMKERIRCLRIVLDVLNDRPTLSKLTAAGALLAVVERINDPAISKISI